MFGNKSILDDVLRVGAYFDWITPSFAFLQDILSGGAAHFGVPANIPYRRSDIKNLLNQFGIQVWGLMYDFDEDILMFTVKKRDAEWTYRILMLAGIPAYYAPIDPPDF